jgi:threonine dehydratase
MPNDTIELLSDLVAIESVNPSPVAGGAGNYGRAVAHVAAMRGLRCRAFLPRARPPSAARRSRPKAPR